MKVKEALELLMLPSHFVFKGSYSGKVYYNSDTNTLATKHKYEKYECPDKPIDVIMKCTEAVAYPCVVIWFMDYEICKNRSKPTVND